MSRSLKITIEESAEFLEKQLKNSRSASLKERIQVLWWLKTGQVQEHQELAHRLGRDKSTITGVVTKVSTGWIIGIIVGEKSPRTSTTHDSGGISRAQRTFRKRSRLQKLRRNC